MAGLAIVTWNLPNSPDAMEKYQRKIDGWASDCWRAGAVALSAYRQSGGATPQAIALVEFSSLAAAQKAKQSALGGSMRRELEQVGCTQVSVTTWESSPLLPARRTPDWWDRN
jgi:hypothetical protein